MTGLDAVAASQCVGRQSQGVGAGREQRGWNQSSRGLPCFSEWTIRLALSAASLRPQSALRARAGDEDRGEQDIFRMASKVIALSSTDRLGGELLALRSSGVAGGKAYFSCRPDDQGLFLAGGHAAASWQVAPVLGLIRVSAFASKSVLR